MDDFRVLNRDGLRWPDEFVRHKVLDLLGDLALLGMPIEGHLVVERGGHALHQRFVRALLEHPSHWTVENQAPQPPPRGGRAARRAGARLGLRRALLVLEGLELSRQLGCGRGVGERDAHAARADLAGARVRVPVLPGHAAFDRVQRRAARQAEAQAERRAERERRLRLDEQAAAPSVVAYSQRGTPWAWKSTSSRTSRRRKRRWLGCGR